MNQLDLCYLSTAQALACFRNKTLSPVELLEALIARSHTVEPTIKAFSDTYFDEAKTQAKQAEQAYVKNPSAARALEGIPTAIKDEVGLAGKRTTSGSLITQNYVSEKDGYIVERLRAAGAIFHARTTTPEFCCAGITHSKLHGITRSPWNTEYTSGGSSGGSGATLAAGTSLLASGSDIGGSIRIPSAMCGLVGFKPPYGRNPEDAIPYNLDTYNHQGPMARSVVDCALMQNIISGPHPKDIATVKPKIDIPLELNTDLRGWKIAYSFDLDFYAVDEEVISNMKNMLAILRDLGAHTEEVKLGWTSECNKASMSYLSHLFGGDINDIIQGNEALATDYAREFARLAQHTTARDFLDAQITAGHMYNTFGPMMENYHVFICPTLATTHVKADHNAIDPITIAGREVDGALGWCMTPPFNMLSRCPVLSMPSGLARNQIPTAIQIVGKTYDDETVFRVAYMLEKANPWYVDTHTRPKI